jgi:hypothetical protein
MWSRGRCFNNINVKSHEEQKQLSRIEQIIREHLPELEEAWHEYFAK